jgi:hypothetical protein
MSNTTNESPKRLPKQKGRRHPVVIRLTKEDHEELVHAAKAEMRTLGNMALMRYERGCNFNRSNQP